MKMKAITVGELFPVEEEEHYDCVAYSIYEKHTFPDREDSSEDITSKKYKTWAAVESQYMEMYLTERIESLKTLLHQSRKQKIMNKIRSMFSRN